MSEVAHLLMEDAKEKRMARGGRGVGKERPKTVVLPSLLAPAWWWVAPPVVWVDIKTGAVLVFAWPLSENVEAWR